MRRFFAWLFNTPCRATGKDGRACLKTARRHEGYHVSASRVWNGGFAP